MDTLLRGPRGDHHSIRYINGEYISLNMNGGYIVSREFEKLVEDIELDDERRQALEKVFYLRNKTLSIIESEGDYALKKLARRYGKKSFAEKEMLCSPKINWQIKLDILKRVNYKSYVDYVAYSNMDEYQILHEIRNDVDNSDIICAILSQLHEYNNYRRDGGFSLYIDIVCNWVKKVGSRKKLETLKLLADNLLIAIPESNGKLKDVAIKKHKLLFLSGWIKDRLSVMTNATSFIIEEE